MLKKLHERLEELNKQLQEADKNIANLRQNIEQVAANKNAILGAIEVTKEYISAQDVQENNKDIVDVAAEPEPAAS